MAINGVQYAFSAQRSSRLLKLSRVQDVVAKLEKGWSRQGFGEAVRQLVSSVDSCEVDSSLVYVLIEETEPELVVACRFDAAQSVPELNARVVVLPDGDRDVGGTDAALLAHEFEMSSFLDALGDCVDFRFGGGLSAQLLKPAPP